MPKEIKIFLGGYVNYINAQNLNCRALSEHLDKKKFHVSTLLYPIKNATDFIRVPGVKYIQLHRPFFFLNWIYWLKGIACADVAYLPKGEIDVFCRVIAKFFRTKVFTTMEIVLDTKTVSSQKNIATYINHLKEYEPHLFAITKFIQKREHKDFNLNFDSEILYLGVDTKKFECSHVGHSILKNIIFIGNDLIRKDAKAFLEMALKFPEITFNIVGGKELGEYTVDEYLKRNSIINVKFYGYLDHSQIAKLLQRMDLMFFPSRCEGFPKVILETACAGVPTLCYSDYGAEEWITTGKDGFVVNTKEEAFAVIQDLKEHPEKLPLLSQNAVVLGKRFNWSVLVKEWEKVIEKIYKEK